MKKRLVTSALPYVNNVPHLGNIIQVLSADCFARYCKLKGYETLYVCGTDEYGTASETRALQEGITPRELCDRYHVVHKAIYDWFGIGFDVFGRTSDPMQTQIVQDIFKAVDEAGYIREAEIQQLFCEHDDRFLADRFVEGVCPKCGSDGARGDQCDSCGTLLDPMELIDPRCGVCGNRPVPRVTKHLYLDLPKALPLLESWMNDASEKGFWARNAVQITRSWIRDGLKERAITRDLKWGIPVPKEGYEDKVFYVWFDAPIGYISITAALTEQWKTWWQNPEEVELFQFIGKDNIPFHTVIFPSTLLATGQSWTMLHHMSSTEYLNYEGGKFSKSKGIGVFGNDVQDTGIPADAWRFYIYYNRPEKADVLFTWSDFQDKVNGELIGNLSNLVNRTLSFVSRFYEGIVPDGPVDKQLMNQFLEKIAEIDSLLDHAELREAFRQLFVLSSMGNKAFQDGEPWKNRKEHPEAAAALIRTLSYMVRDLGTLMNPFMPSASKRLLGFFGIDRTDWSSLGVCSGQLSVKDVSHLFSKLEDDQVNRLRIRYSGSQSDRKGETMEVDNSVKAESMSQEKVGNQVVDVAALALQFAVKVSLRVSKIVEVERHPQGDMLYILSLDTGESERRIIVSSIVPFYSPEELINRNIVLVSNLKPANFRGVKSRGMLLAANDPQAEPHTTCEVLFADQFAVGTELLPQETSLPEGGRGQVKADVFFSFPLHTRNGIVSVGEVPIGSGSDKLVAHTYINGDVG